MQKVSVIIPAYNAARFLPETIESVLGQTWQNLELIVVNDGSIDDTREVIRKFQEDPRLVYIDQVNMGCSPAKNTGLFRVTGDFIQYLDADDLLAKDKIALQVAAIQEDPGAVAVGKTLVFYERAHMDGLEELDSEFLHTTDNTFEFLLGLYGINGKRGMIQPNSFLISKQLSDLAGSWDTSLSPSPDEDGEYFCRVLLHASRLVYVPGAINYYRRQHGKKSLSAQHSEKHARGALQSIRLKTSYMLARENSERVRKLMGSEYASYVYLYHNSYPNLAHEAIREIHSLGIKNIPITGGPAFQKAASFLGMPVALKLKAIKENLFG